MTETVRTLLPYVQIVLSILLVTLILIQRSEAGLGSAFGADNYSGAQYKRRGAERAMFLGTIFIAILFSVSALVAFLI